ncbi:hypothetical protein BS47DRAFT_502824 [Hydnum rufescens UP504]|uniref:Uncharacterized protein n=1 Tax=Hydnum rufescens UP504 TaxID=1448309 RepID=A0A9P6B749_9AGAM|nr:hypothetical protein BS47DRAFT_502824 [Hydnum rufescens UP504]
MPWLKLCLRFSNSLASTVTAGIRCGIAVRAFVLVADPTCVTIQEIHPESKPYHHRRKGLCLWVTLASEVSRLNGCSQDSKISSLTLLRLIVEDCTIIASKVLNSDSTLKPSVVESIVQPSHTIGWQYIKMGVDSVLRRKVTLSRPGYGVTANRSWPSGQLNP